MDQKFVYVDVVRLTFADIDCRVPKITKTAIFVLPKNKEVSH